jgi:hypothetical protein
VRHTCDREHYLDMVRSGFNVEESIKGEQS